MRSLNKAEWLGATQFSSWSLVNKQTEQVVGFNISYHFKAHTKL